MVPTVLFYPLLLVALVLICLLLHVWWPDPSRAPPPWPLKPDKPQRKRSKEPTQLFTGYIDKPLCEACETGINARSQALGSPPPILTFNRGRKRPVDTQAPFCPTPNCSSQSWLGRGNLRSNGHPGGQPWRQ
jgi:hypothetical protein